MRGFISLGKLATSEFGAMPVTEPEIHPPTLNPWDIIDHREVQVEVRAQPSQLIYSPSLAAPMVEDRFASHQP